MGTNHTQGEWKGQAGPDDAIWIKAEGFGPPGTPLAKVYLRAVEGHYPQSSYAERDANAMLIEKAPAMYEKLIAVVDDLDWDLDDYDTPYNMDDVIHLAEHLRSIASWVVKELRPAVEGKAVQHDA